VESGGALRGGGMMGRNIEIIACIAVMFFAGMAIGTFAPTLAKKPEKAPAPQPQAQKFRFGEQCPDGLRVEYVSTYRLPKAVVCQQPVGE